MPRLNPALVPLFYEYSELRIELSNWETTLSGPLYVLCRWFQKLSNRSNGPSGRAIELLGRSIELLERSIEL